MRKKKFSFLVDGRSVTAWAEKKMDIMQKYAERGTVLTAPEIKRIQDERGNPEYQEPPRKKRLPRRGIKTEKPPGALILRVAWRLLSG